MNIEFGRRFTATLAYHVLAALDLGRDAANLYRGARSRASWAPPLEAAYLAAGVERLELQFAGLAFAETEALLAWSRATSSSLRQCFAQALEVELPAVRQRFAATSVEAERRIEEARAAISQPLQALRAALWSPRSPPPLTVLHVPELGRAGRAYPRRDRHWVAVSFESPLEELLCQIFHEEVHPVSDRELGEMKQRDTRANSSGASIHQRLEQHALRRGAEVVSASVPELRRAYERWAEGTRLPR